MAPAGGLFAPGRVQARTVANFVAPGREQDELLRKARKAEMLASATDRLALLNLRSRVHFCTDALLHKRFIVRLSALKIASI